MRLVIDEAAKISAYYKRDVANPDTVPPLHKRAVEEGSDWYGNGDNVFNFRQHWVYALMGTTIGFVTLLAVSVYVIIKRIKRKANSPLTPDPPKQPSFHCPPVTIPLSVGEASQPPTDNPHHPHNIIIPTTSPHHHHHLFSTTTTTNSSSSSSPNSGSSPTARGQSSSSIQHPHHQLIHHSASSSITNSPSTSTSTNNRMPSEPPPSQRSSGNRGRGLLERRGSNASLTIDLAAQPQPMLTDQPNNNNDDSAAAGLVFAPVWGTPPKECSTKEYLTSATNRMTRRQLRSINSHIKNLHQEFIDIPLNHPGKLDLPGCSNKNRYKSIWPNSHSIVRLAERGVGGGNVDVVDLTSTYINANYLRGYGGEARAFIGTQGPLPHTINDFWRMIWQENAPAIVMMTRLKEKNRVKCEPYLPTRESEYSGIHVIVGNTIAKNGYYVRDLILQEGNELKQVKHYWFTGWPDQKAPRSTAKQLLQMAQEVESERMRQRLTRLNVGPVIVHCSAGIGRTGCFIGTCIGMRQLCEESMIDVLGIVCQMRLDRGGMIQTPEQYEFLHYVLNLFESELPQSPAMPPLTSSNSNSPVDNNNGTSGSQQPSPMSS